MDFSEKFIIEVIDNFSFLKQYGYTVKETKSYGVSPYVAYENKNVNREISFTYEGILFISFNRKSPKFFSREKDWHSTLDLAYEHFNAREIKACKDPFQGLKLNAEFMKTYLMPIVKGELWVDKLLKKSSQKTK